MDYSDMIRLIKTCFFEWKPFLPLQKTLEDFISQAKLIDTDAQDEDLMDFQSSIVSQTVSSNVFKEFPPHPGPTVQFIKRFLLVLEEHGIEGHDAFYNYISATNNITSQPSPRFYKSYFDEGGDHLVSLIEKPELICEGTTGLRTWQAGKFLFAWLRRNPHHLPKERDYTLLELGSGAGFTGISLCKTYQDKPRRIIFTDHHSTVLNVLLRNIKANLNYFGMKIKCNQPGQVCELGDEVEFPVELYSDTDKQWLIVDTLEWESFIYLNEIDIQRFKCDIVIGADIVFDTSLIPHLVNVLVTFLTQLGAKKVILANCIRNITTDDMFTKRLKDKNIYFVKENYIAEDSSPVNLYIIENCKNKEQ